MGPISVTANAGLEIIRKLASGELEVHGILLRDTGGKKFRYILRGFEDLPKDAAHLNDLPSLGPLQTALNLTQLLQIVSVAQNAAVAASLRRIEARLDAIDLRLNGIDLRLKRFDAKLTLLQAAGRAAPVSRLKAAKTAAVVALRHGDQTALIAAGTNMQQAFHDLFEQAKDLIRIEEDGLPVAILTPTEHADLVESAADAAFAASAVWLALGDQAAAATLMRESGDGIAAMRRKLACVYADPKLLLRRMAADQGQDLIQMAAGERLRHALHWTRGRAALIEQGLISADPARIEFERIAPIGELCFVPIADSHDPAFPALPTG